SASIHYGVPIGGGLSFADRMRSMWRYWSGNFDLGFNVQQATTDTTGFLVGFKTVRSKEPTRLTLASSYRYGTQKETGKERPIAQELGLGPVRGEHDITPRFYGFGSGDATYDGVQRLSIRGVPKAGLGYVIWEDKLDELKRNFLSLEAGPSWVYERYFGGMD